MAPRPRPYPMTLVLVFYYLLSSFSASSSASRISLPSESEKVSLSLYYEALCPYSASFVVNGLAKLFQSGLIDIVPLNLVPWGNAKLSRGNTTFACQHGPSECLLNTIEACVIDAWPTVGDHFPLIYCIEKMVHTHDFTQWESCFSELGLDSKPVYDCYTSGRGTELELQYAAETNALQPPHQYVPWVVVNGKPLYEDYENFESYICEAYSGTSAPKACSELSHDAIKSTISVEKHQGCYKDNSAFISRMREAAALGMRWINVVG